MCFWMTDIENGQVIYVSPAYGGDLETHMRELVRIAALTHPRRSIPGTANASCRAPPPTSDPEGRIRRGISYSVRPGRRPFAGCASRAFPIFDRTGESLSARGDRGRRHPTQAIGKKSPRSQRPRDSGASDATCTMGCASISPATIFASKILEEELAKQSLPQAAQAGQIAEFIDRAISQATRDVARGLDPVKVATNGLMSALEELAATVRTVQRPGLRFPLGCTPVS